MWQTRPTIIIKKLGENRYRWFLYLSSNMTKPTCISPSEYTEAFKCRSRAKEFAQKFKGPIILRDKVNKTQEKCTDGVCIIDETVKQSPPTEVESTLQ